jgi:hypothetical protein
MTKSADHDQKTHHGLHWLHAWVHLVAASQQYVYIMILKYVKVITIAISNSMQD